MSERPRGPKVRLTPDALDYGTVCPECAGPKHRQSQRCAACYYDARRRGDYPDPPVRRGPAHPRWNGGPEAKRLRRLRTGSQANAQPQSHPWRRRAAA